MQATVATIGAEKVGIRLSPHDVFNGTGPFSEIDSQYAGLTAALSARAHGRVAKRQAHGCKLISASIKARRAGYLISLFDQEMMGLAALIDGNRITGMRTALTAAVAVDAAAPRKPLKVAVIGSGFEAKGLLAALADVRGVARVRVFGPTPANRQSFASTLHEEYGLHMEVAASASEAIDGADVVICAARSAATRRWSRSSG